MVNRIGITNKNLQSMMQLAKKQFLEFLSKQQSRFISVNFWQNS